MATDPYQILGVKKTATEAELRTAYRKLAKQNHPDLNPGKPEAAERFKRISVAYDLLSDKEKRARFDRGEIDAEGNERAPERPFYRDYADAAAGGGQRRYSAGAGGGAGMSPDDLEEILAQAFGHARRGAAGGGPGFDLRGADVRYTLTIDFIDAANGVTRRITLPDGRTLDVRIPAGVRDGHVLRLRGQGEPGLGSGPAGDALVEVSIAPHPYFVREGDDIVMSLPVTIQEAVLGASLEVPTIGGKVRLGIPANSGTGTRLRLRGRGIGGRGHQYVDLRVVLPRGEEPALAEFLRGWTPATPFNPRSGMGDGMRDGAPGDKEGM
ncbi:MAG: J domain-containing protein [Proteobacteria bacterium]|nr:J domain-containing protein [Pseudomonadota bacterium]